MTRRDILIVDDHPAVAFSIAAALSPAFAVRVVHTVDDALAALDDAPAACVLDLSLDRDPAPLHDALAGIPVLVVSGLDGDEARATAARRGWRVREKPFTDSDLRAEVGELLAGAPPPARPSAPALEPQQPAEEPPAPEPPAAPLPAPPAAPTASDAPLHADWRVAVVDLLSRRALRGGCVLTLSILSIYGMVHHIPVDGLVVGALSALGMGAEAFIGAVRKRPAASAAGALALVALGVSSGLSDITELGAVATAGAAAATALVDHARAG